MTSTNPEYLWEKRNRTVYKAELSALYHQKRERFFELCDKLGKAISIIGGSAAVWNVTNKDFIPWIAIAITVSSTMSLVFGFSERARRHADLSRRYKTIITAIVAIGELNFNLVQINEWNEKISLVEHMSHQL